jgi:hypothetical protein
VHYGVLPQTLMSPYLSHAQSQTRRSAEVTQDTIRKYPGLQAPRHLAAHKFEQHYVVSRETESFDGLRCSLYLCRVSACWRVGNTVQCLFASHGCLGEFTTATPCTPSVLTRQPSKVLDILAADTHYKYFALLLVPTTAYFVIANWVGWQYYRNS